MPRKGFYVLGLEPGTAVPVGRGANRTQGTMPMIEGQAEYDVTVEVEILDSTKQFEEIETQAKKLAGK
jgi:hypothetical protein